MNQGSVTIDASNAGVILDGMASPQGTNGLIVTSNNNVIKGLQVIRFPLAAIRIQNASNNIIGGNRTSGACLMGEGNLLSGNGTTGIEVHDGANNVIVGNFVGTEITGDVAFGNGSFGILLGNGARHNRIGSTSASERNLVSGNGGMGIGLLGDSVEENLVIGNFVGTDVSGAKALGNASIGIFLHGGASNNQIGGLNPREGNLVSGKNNTGISMMERSHGNSVLGNLVGTDVSGQYPLGNLGHGISMELGAYNNLIQGNLSSGNLRSGVCISDRGSNYNTVIGNLLGTNATGTAAIGNGMPGGVHMAMGAMFNRVGGKTVSERNVLSGNTGSGIYTGERGRGMGAIVLGNFIGTDISGERAIGNTGFGVILGDSIHNFIGGPGNGEGNLISGNPVYGIYLGGTEFNYIAGNTIGASGRSLPSLGNGKAGVGISDYSQRNIVGPGNVIGFNGEFGVFNDGAENPIRQNRIFENGIKGIWNRTHNIVARPLIQELTLVSVAGEACPRCTVDIFSDSRDEGEIYEGTTTGDASGRFVFSKASAFAGPNIISTATDRRGNTSEFSAPRSVFLNAFADSAAEHGSRVFKASATVNPPGPSPKARWNGDPRPPLTRQIDPNPMMQLRQRSPSPLLSTDLPAYHAPPAELKRRQLQNRQRRASWRRLSDDGKSWLYDRQGTNVKMHTDIKWTWKNHERSSHVRCLQHQAPKFPATASYHICW